MPKTDTEVSELDQDALRDQVRTELQDIAAFLQHAFGQRLVAYMAGVEDHKAVGAWARGDREPRPAARKRLETAYRVALLLQRGADDHALHMVRAWFGGLNGQLGDNSPADAIRNDQHRDVLVAARSFVAG